MELEKLDLSVRTYNLLRRAGINTVEEFQERFHNDADLDKKVGTKALCEATTAWAKWEQSMQQKPTEAAVVVSEEYIRATELHKRYKANMYSAAMSIVDAGKCLSEMKRDKLYKQFGYQNFDDYCENEAKIGRDQAYKMIRIVENLPEDFVESTRQIGIEKLATLATLPFEQVQEVVEHVDVESVTVKELKTHIKELETEKQASAQALDEITADKNLAEERVEKLKNQRDELRERICDLENQVEELENRPIDHIIVPDHETQNQIEAMKKMDREWSERYSSLQEAQFKEIQELHRQHKAELEELRTQNTGQEQTEESKEFYAYLHVAEESIARVYRFLCKQGKDSQERYTPHAVQLLEKYRMLFAFEDV